MRLSLMDEMQIQVNWQEQERVLVQEQWLKATTRILPKTAPLKRVWDAFTPLQHMVETLARSIISLRIRPRTLHRPAD